MWRRCSAAIRSRLWLQLTRLVPAAVVSTYADREVTDDLRQCRALPVVAFWDVDPKFLIEADEEVEMVEGIDVQRLTHIVVRCQCAGISLGGNASQHLDNGLLELGFSPSVLASCR